MPTTLPTISPFKLLRSYDKEDIRHYFGRDKETRQLYDALMRSKFMMVYGASGTGKTSLIQCGLQSMYSPRDWMPILVRRRNDFLTPLHDELYRRYLERFEEHRRQQAEWYPDEPTTEPETFDNLRDLIKALFHLSYVPIYLILDQFEEIFTVGRRNEQDEFFNALEALNLFSEDLFCKVIIVTREEYIAHFYRYEHQLPFLFEHRFRVEKMRPEQLLQVINGTLTTPYPNYPDIELEAGADEEIRLNLTDDLGEVDLTTLQVYLGRLYQEDRKRAGSRNHILIDKQLVKGNKLDDVMADFLSRQVERVSAIVFRDFAALKERGANLPMQFLFQMVTGQGTKQNRSAEEIYKEFKGVKGAPTLSFVQACLNEFASPESRILNRLRFAKTEAERYEVMHDRLAERIFAQFTKEEVRRREARTTIRNKLRRFREAPEKRKKQEYLSEGEIELVAQSLNIEGQEDELKSFFYISQAHHKAKRKRERRTTILASVAAVFFLLLAAAAWAANQRANRNLNQFLSAQAEKVQSEVTYLLGRADELDLVGYPAQSDSLVRDAHRLLLGYRENPQLDSIITDLESKHSFLKKEAQ